MGSVEGHLQESDDDELKIVPMASWQIDVAADEAELGFDGDGDGERRDQGVRAFGRVVE